MNACAGPFNETDGLLGQPMTKPLGQVPSQERLGGSLSVGLVPAVQVEAAPASLGCMAVAPPYA